MNIEKSTEDYEHWLARYTPIVKEDIATKHQLMKTGTFPFMRATFYRWLECWQDLSSEIAKAPVVLCVGDIHVDNFGTWRDAEGRLVWGINDFDEACFAPYTLDLARLIASAHLAIEANNLSLKAEEASESIVEGYTSQITNGGQPFVLSEQHEWLRPMALSVLREPVKYWHKIDALPKLETEAPIGAVVALEHLLPEPGLKYSLRTRVAGLGSLGHQRLVAVAQYRGGRVAREAKAMVPAAMAWVKGAEKSVEILYQAIIERSVRCRDPFVRLDGQWIVRRLAPDCSRIELSAMTDERDEAHLLKAMGQELANIHLSSEEVGKTIGADLAARKGNWFAAPVAAMVERVKHDYEKWCATS